MQSLQKETNRMNIKHEQFVNNIFKIKLDVDFRKMKSPAEIKMREILNNYHNIVDDFLKGQVQFLFLYFRYS